MIEQEAEIVNRLGLHARAAALLVKLTNQFKSSINISNQNNNANAKNIMEVLMLAATKGSDVLVTVDGPDEKKAMKAVLKLIKNKFNELQ